ncbi:MAG: dihydroorotase [Dehalococcoidales bacterium]|nr:dihydroorotase [Dehalococcoidales bacterium]
MRLLIKNGRVIDPANGIDNLFDVLVEDGTIKGVAPKIESENAVMVDASNKVVSPGLIDMHVHFRQPGRHEYKETIRTGSCAAAKGGFTTVVCEPNTLPPIDNADKVKQVLDIARKVRIVNVYTKASITKRLRGKEVINVRKVVSEGAVALTDDGFPVKEIDVMDKAAREARKYGIPICPHCEETRLRGRREAKVRARYNSEAAYIDRDIHVVKDTGCSFHFSHVSLAKSVNYIAHAKKEGLPVTAEATPHHFTLTKNDAREIGPNARVNPPLRTAKDVEAIKKALQDNIIDVIATDHAPHAPYEKMSDNPPFGVIGLETALGIVLTYLVHPGILSLSSAIEKLTVNPAKILNLKKGKLSVGMAADITIIDPNKDWVVDVNEFASKGRNCPFDGWKLKGKAVMTIVGGKVVMNEGEIYDPPLEDPRLLRQLRLPI